MTAPLAPHPDWQRILVTSEEDEAWQEHVDRADRLAERAPASGFKYQRPQEQHDQAQDHPDQHRADRPAVAAGHRGSDVRHRRDASLAASSWAGSPPEHPGPSLPHRRGDPVPPNAAPTRTAPAELLDGSAGHTLPEEQTP